MSWKFTSTQNLHMDVYSGSIQDFQNLEASISSINECINKLRTLYSGILFSTEKNWTIKPQKHMGTWITACKTDVLSLFTLKGQIKGKS